MILFAEHVLDSSLFDTMILSLQWFLKNNEVDR